MQWIKDGMSPRRPMININIRNPIAKKIRKRNFLAHYDIIGITGVITHIFTANFYGLIINFTKIIDRKPQRNIDR